MPDRTALRSALALCIAGLALPAAAQTPAPAVPLSTGAPLTAVVPILTVDQDRLFSGTKYGQAITRRFEAEATALQDENRRIDSGLEQEERDLTDRRATMDPAAFRALADEFDAKVEGLRTAQDAKSKDLTRRREEAQQTFYKAAVPVLGQLMQDQGAVAIIDKKALILSFDRIDITDAAITRIDAALGDGTTPPPTPSP